MSEAGLARLDDLALVIAQFFGEKDSPQDAARAIIAAGWTLVPEDHVVVPREPTQKMWQAASDADEDPKRREDLWNAVWRAMIAAAGG